MMDRQDSIDVDDEFHLPLMEMVKKQREKHVSSTTTTITTTTSYEKKRKDIDANDILSSPPSSPIKRTRRFDDSGDDNDDNENSGEGYYETSSSSKGNSRTSSSKSNSSKSSSPDRGLWLDDNNQDGEEDDDYDIDQEVENQFQTNPKEKKQRKQRELSKEKLEKKRKPTTTKRTKKKADLDDFIDNGDGENSDEHGDADMDGESKSISRKTSSKQKQSTTTTTTTTAASKKHQPKAPKKKSKKEALKDMVLLFEENLYHLPETKDLLNFISEDITVQFRQTNIQFSIIWRRKMDGGGSKTEKYIILKYPPDILYEYVEKGQLVEIIDSLTRNNLDKRFILFVEGLDQFLKTKSRSVNSSLNNNNNNSNDLKYISKQDIEKTFVLLRIEYKIMIYQPSNRSDFGFLLTKLTEVLANAPYKQNVNELFEGFCAEAIKKKAKTPSEIWLYQLSTIHGISSNIARCIVLKYPTFTSLYRAYEQLNDNNQDREMMLSNLKLESTSQNTTKAPKRLGPSLSSKIYKFVFSNDPNIII